MRERRARYHIVWGIACTLLLAVSGSRATIAQALPGRVLSLSEALRIAQQRHVSVIVSSERVQQAMARLSQAWSTLLPHVSGTMSQKRQTKNLEAVGIMLPGRDAVTDPFDSFDARVQVTQNILDLAAIDRLNAAKLGKALSLAELRKAEQDALALVATLYLDAERAARALDAASASLAFEEEQLRLTRTSFDLGVRSSLEVSQMRAQRAARWEAWQAALATAIDRQLDLAAALGWSPDQPIVFIADGVLEPHVGLLDQRLLRGLDAHPEIDVARTTLQEANAERAANISDFLPKVAASADYGLSGEYPDNSDATYTFGAQVSVPFFEGGLRHARVREAASRVRESQVLLDDAMRQVDAQARSALQALSHAQALVEASTMELDVAATASDLASHRVMLGTGSTLDQHDATTTFAHAKDRYAEALASYQHAEVQLAHALGHMELLIGEPR